MIKEQVWAKFCEINPSFLIAAELQLTPTQLKKMIETAYKYGHEEGFERGKDVTRKLYKAANPGNGNMDIFKDIFNQK
jgi:hypothetical protein